MLICEPIPGEHPREWIYSLINTVNYTSPFRLKMALAKTEQKYSINVHSKGHSKISLVNSITCYINFTTMSLLQLTLPSAKKAHKVFL